MMLSRLHQRLIGIAVVAALMGCVPATVGYAWAIAWLPVYGAVCHFDKIFGSAISPDGYRIYLLGHGCDLDAAVRQIVATRPDLSVDPSRIVAIQRGALRAESADEFLATDLVRTKLRDFASSNLGDNGCGPDGYCAIPDSSSDNLIAKIPRVYMAYARSQFLYALNDGADYMTSLLRTGPIVQGVTFFVYAMAALAFGKLVANFLASLRKW